MNFKKTAALAAVAVLGATGAAEAAKPTTPSKGQEKQKAAKTQKVGFSLKGVTATLPLGTEGAALTGALSLDPTSANKAARSALGLGTPKALKASTETVDVTDAVQGLTVTYVGFGDDKMITATDKVKVIGKVTRTRTKSGKGKPSFTYGDVDIRKVVVTRGETETENQG